MVTWNFRCFALHPISGRLAGHGDAGLGGWQSARLGVVIMVLVFLHGPEELISPRLAERKGHFMDPNLLQSQFEALEVPEGPYRSISRPPPK
jgi:hypothetical protein